MTRKRPKKSTPHYLNIEYFFKEREREKRISYYYWDSVGTSGTKSCSLFFVSLSRYLCVAIPSEGQNTRVVWCLKKEEGPLVCDWSKGPSTTRRQKKKNRDPK